MKKQSIGRPELASLLLLLALMLALASPAMAQGGYRGNGPGPGSGLSAEPATADEARWLAYMREEEKLARDVYQQLYEKWDLNIFRNITASESRHYNAVGTLLARYGVSDPARNTQPGIYADAKLAALYQELIAKGMRSVKDALEVGVLIEKTDIADLETALKAAAKLDIKRVYTNLLNGSYNHLEAFESNLEILAASTAAPPR